MSATSGMQVWGNLIQTAAYATLAIGQLYLFLSWLATKRKQAAADRQFLHELRTNHLKHIQHYLVLICKKLDIDYYENE